MTRKDLIHECAVFLHTITFERREYKVTGIDGHTRYVVPIHRLKDTQPVHLRTKDSDARFSRLNQKYRDYIQNMQMRGRNRRSFTRDIWDLYDYNERFVRMVITAVNTGKYWCPEYTVKVRKIDNRWCLVYTPKAAENAIDTVSTSTVMPTTPAPKSDAVSVVSNWIESAEKQLNAEPKVIQPSAFTIDLGNNVSLNINIQINIQLCTK